MEAAGAFGALLGDLRRLAERMDWSCLGYDELVELARLRPQGLRGVSLLVHPRCEWLHLHVDSEGRFLNCEWYVCSRGEPYEVDDETGYYAHRDLDKLQADLAYVDRVLGAVRRAAGQLNAEGPPRHGNELIGRLLKRVQEALADVH